MSKRRRMFEIEMPEEAEAAAAAPDPDRRGPMASAVRETADSLRARSEAEAEIRAENDALAHELVQLRRDGLILQRIPLGAVRTDKLARDRKDLNEGGLRELIVSIQAIGLSNPIQVEAAGEGAFELVQGLRRLTAYRRLHEETSDPAWAAIPAMVLPAGEALDGLYRRMVDENLIRSDISFAEMAALARAYAEDPGTGADTVDAAVGALYGSAGKQKRSYIRAFARLLDEIGGFLDHADAIPRALGLAVRKRLEETPSALANLQRSLTAGRPRDVATELALLRAFAGGAGGASAPAPTFPAGNPDSSSARPQRRARTTFEVSSPLGPVKCSASQGKLELRIDADFSAMDRRRLEQAIARMLESLGKNK